MVTIAPSRLKRCWMLVSVLGIFGLECIGCVRVSAINVSRKTSLERQMIGAFEPLSDEALMVSSVRQQPVALSRTDPEAADALAARRRQRFHQDEILAWKKHGCLGEAADARLVERACDFDDAQLREETRGGPARLSALLQAENADRAAIVSWAMQRLQTGEQAESEIWSLYAASLRNELRTGDWYQSEAGVWLQR